MREGKEREGEGAIFTLFTIDTFFIFSSKRPWYFTIWIKSLLFFNTLKLLVFVSMMCVLLPLCVFLFLENESSSPQCFIYFRYLVSIPLNSVFGALVNG